MNTSIVVAGQKFDIGSRVILWDEPGGFSFYPTKKFDARDLDLDGLRQEIKLFTIHHSVTYTAADTFHGLNGRLLSVNFIMEDDVGDDGCATIYQCLDVKDAGMSQGEFNKSGPGIEISLQPAAWSNPNLYSDDMLKKHGVTAHEVKDDFVDGKHFKCFGPTEAQHKSLSNLLIGFCTAFPNVPKQFPKDDSNNYVKELLKDPHSFSGICNHYNLNREKLDCLGLDLATIDYNLNL